MKKSFLFVCLTIIALTTVLPHYVAARNHEQQVEKHFKAAEGGTLYLNSDRGSVKIRGQAFDEVDVVVTLKADTRNKEEARDWFDRFELTFDHRGKDVEIRGEWDDSWFGRRNKLKVHFDIQVPKRYNLDVDTAGGSIWLDDLSGEVRLETSGGSIAMGEIEGPVWAETSGGSISLERAKGDASVHTSGGSITLSKIEGSVDAKTSGGTISVDGVDGNLQARTSGGSLRLTNINGNLKARTSGGSIHAELLKQIDEPAELRTSGGSITLEIPANLKADIDASTSGGRVMTDIPLTIQGTLSKGRIQGTMNGGGERISLRTSGGNIEIRER